MSATSRDIIASPLPPTSTEFQRIAAGDQQSCRALIDRWETVIKVIASAYASWKSPLPDLIQVGRIAVYKAALKYNVECGSPFANYTKRAIKNAVIQEATRLSGQWRLAPLPDKKWERSAYDQSDVLDDRINLVREWVRNLSELSWFSVIWKMAPFELAGLG
jgi:hypothetical protein